MKAIFRHSNRLLLFWGLTFCILSSIPKVSFSQTDTVNCYGALPNYLTDAKILALRHLYETNNSYKDSVTIPITLINSVLRDLAAVYQISITTSTIVPIFNYCGVDCGIHCQPYPNISDFGIFVDTSYQWVKNIYAGNLISSNDTVDALVNQYGLIYGSADYTPLWNAIEVFTSYPINVTALGKEFERISGVNMVNTSASSLDGNNITMADSGLYREYVFDYGFGDCWTGCIGHHYWKFRVYSNCIVEYMGEYGNQIPSSISEVSDAENLFAISPNPATTKLTCTITYPTNKTTLQILSIEGRAIMQNIPAIQTKTEIDVSSLPAGLYFLVLQDEKQRVVRRFVKQ